MNEIYAAIIGGVFVLLVPFVTILIDRFIKGKRFTNLDSKYRHIVQGKWDGYFKQIYNGEEITVALVLNIRVSSSGVVKGNASFEFDHKKLKMLVSGGFYLPDFLEMNYRNAQKKTVQFGAFVFKIDYHAKTLVGHFAGYGPVSQKVISGPAVLEKTKK